MAMILLVIAAVIGQSLALKSYPAAECGHNPVNIQFLLDSSGSVKIGNFTKALDFVKGFINPFTVGPDAAQFGLATFSTDVVNEFWLNDYSDKNSVLTAVGAVKYTAGHTMTDLALDFARENAFTSAHGGRSGVQDVLICITDGESQNPLYTAMAAKKVHEAMIMVLGVGVGDAVNQTELEYISTDPSRTFSVANWDALNFIMDKLRTKACEICDFWVGTNAVLIDGRCIREFPGPKTWDDAKAACEQEGKKNGVSNVRLLRLLTEEMREYAQDVVTKSGKRTWIDGNDKYVEGVWVYYDRSPANFQQSWWGQGQPDNDGNEDCVVMRFDGLLNDYSCDATLPFLCEAVVVKEGL